MGNYFRLLLFGLLTIFGNTNIAQCVFVEECVVLQDESCEGNDDGEIEAGDCPTCTEYSIDGTNWLTSSVFTGLTPGNYIIEGRDVNGMTCECEQVEVLPGSMPDISCDAIAESCEGENDGSVSVSVNEQNPPYSYAWDDPNSSNTSTVTDLSSGIYTVIVTDNNECEESCEVEIEEGPTPVIPTFSFAIMYCDGDNVPDLPDLSDNDVMGSWSPSSIDNLQSNTYTFTPDSGECADPIDVFIEIHDNPQPGISGSTTFCSGGSTTLEADSGYSSYMWSNNSTSASITVATAGTYTVTVTDNDGCTGSSSVMVTESSSLMPTISGDLSFCSGQSTTISASSGFVSYAWSSSQNTASIMVSSAGTYSVTVSDASGCTGTSSVDIIVNSSPPITFSGIASICQSSPPFDLTASPVGGTFTGSGVVGGSTFDPAMANVGMNIISYAYTDANGCSASSIASFNVIQTPVSEISPSSTSVVCQGGTISLNASQAGADLIYNWTGPNNFSSNLKAPMISNVTNLNQGLYTLIVTDTSTTCEYRAATINVTVYTRITGTISASSISCNGGTTTITANPSGGSGSYGYLWNINNQNTQTINGGAGSYSVTISDLLGVCPDVLINENVTEPTPLVATVSVIGESCSGANDGSIVVMSTGGTPNYSYSWSNNSSLPSISNLADGTYNITVTDANSCMDSDVVTVAEGTSVNVSIGGAQSNLCDDASPLTLTANGNAFNYSWQMNNSNAGNNPTLTIGDNEGPGVFTIALTGMTNSENQPNKVCSSVSPFTTISIWDNPDPVITIPSEICQDVAGTVSIKDDDINDDDMGDMHSYMWNNNTSPNQPNAIGIATSQGSTDQNYSLIVTDNHGCSGSTSGSVYVNSKPSVKSDIILSGDSPTVNQSFELRGIVNELETDASLVESKWCFVPEIRQAGTAGTFSSLNGSVLPGLFTELGGSHTFTYKVEDSNGCTNDTSISDNFRAEGSCDLMLDSDVEEICLGDSELLNFTYVKSDPLPNVPPFSLASLEYTLLDADGNDSGIIQVQGNQDLTPNIQFVTPGENILRVIVTETNLELGGCQNTFDFRFFVRNTPELGSVNTGIELDELCDNEPAFINLDDIQATAGSRLVASINLNGTILKDTFTAPNHSMNVIEFWQQANGDYDQNQELYFESLEYLDDPSCLVTDLNIDTINFSVIPCGASAQLEVFTIKDFDDGGDDFCLGRCLDDIVQPDIDNDELGDRFYILSRLSGLDRINNIDESPILSPSTTVRINDINFCLTNIDDLTIEADSTYYLYAAISPLGLSQFVKLSSNPFQINVFPVPNIEDVIMDVEKPYCYGDKDILAITKTSSSDNSFFEQYITWSPQEFVRFSDGDELQDSVFLELSENYDMFFTTWTYRFEGITLECEDKDSLVIPANGISVSIIDSSAFIQWWPGNILACSLEDAPQYKYQWYKNDEALSNGDNWYFLAENDFNDDGMPLSSDGSEINYSVEVLEGDNAECPLRLYYTGDGFVPPRESNSAREAAFTIFPNPNSGDFQIDLPHDFEFIDEIIITDVLGHTVQDVQYNNDTVTLAISLNERTSGLYLCAIRYNNGKVLTQKFIIH